MVDGHLAFAGLKILHDLISKCLIVFQQMALGGNVRLIVTGAAPLSAKVMMFLRCTMGVCCVSQQRLIVDFGAVLSRLVSSRSGIARDEKGQIIISCYNVQFVFTSLRNLNFFILCQLGPFSRQSAIA